MDDEMDGPAIQSALNITETQILNRDAANKATHKENYGSVLCQINHQTRRIDWRGLSTASENRLGLPRMKSPCVRTNCAAEKGHRSYVLYGRRERQRSSIYVPEDLVADVPLALENGRRLKDRDSDGQFLAHYPFGQYIVASGSVWVASTYHPRSFNSRYFGPICFLYPRASQTFFGFLISDFGFTKIIPGIRFRGSYPDREPSST